MPTTEQLETQEARITGYLEAALNLIKIGGDVPRTSLARACGLRNGIGAELEAFGIFGTDATGKTTWRFDGNPAEAAHAFCDRAPAPTIPKEDLERVVEKMVAAQTEHLVQRMRHYEGRLETAETMLLEFGVRLEKIPPPTPPVSVAEVVPSVAPRDVIPKTPPAPRKLRILIVGPHPRDWIHIEKDLAPHIEIVRHDTKDRRPLPSNADVAIWNENAGQFMKALNNLYADRVYCARASISHVRDIIRLVASNHHAS